MMGTTVFIIDSPLHFIFSIAIIKKLNISNYSIHWFNKTSLQVYFPEKKYIDKYNIIDFSYLDFESYSGFINNWNQYITEVKINIDSIDYLFTCYDTHYGFEILRNIFCIPWNNVGIIEDGIGNYFPCRMPRLMKQIPKSIINKIRMSYFLNVSRYNLGGNPKIGFLSTLSPEHVFLHKDSKAKILNIKNEVKNVLHQYPKKSKNVYIEAEVILFLPAVLRYNRMSEKEVISYLRYVKTHPKISSYSNIVIKPHPREKIKLLKDDKIWRIPVENVISIENILSYLEKDAKEYLNNFEAIYAPEGYDKPPEYYDITNDQPKTNNTKKNKINIAVSNFKSDNLSESEINTLVDRLGLELFNTGKFRVIEREDIDLLLTEIELQQSGCTTDQCLIEIGQILGVDIIITGSINKLGTIYSANAKMIDVESGQIINMAKYDHSGDIGGMLLKGIPYMASKLSKY